MRHLPQESSSPPYGIIGCGRVATHFTHYFTLLGIPFRNWSRKSSVACESVLKPCDTLLILIKDSEIIPFVERLRSNPHLAGKKAVHFSGSLVTPLAESAHPLMTFGHEMYDLETYQSIPFITEQGGTPFTELFPELPNPHYPIPAEKKAYYHALCVLSGNFTTLLWKKFFSDLYGRFSIPRQVAEPYLGKIVEHLKRDPENALTGPFSRRDYETMQRNLESLSNENDPYRSVYEAFMKIHKEVRV